MKKYGATGVALHGTCAGRRAARVRGQSWAAGTAKAFVFSTSAGQIVKISQVQISRRALISYEKVQKLQKCVHLPSEPAFSQTESGKNNGKRMVACK